MVAGSLAACGADSEYVEPPAPAVTVATPTVRSVTEYLEVTGTVQSVETVEIRARVEGFLEKVAFREGDDVERGELLYKIDPEEYEARVEQAEAALSTARAALALATATLKRRENAFRSGAVSELQVLESRAQVDVDNARVQSAQAELRRANLDLSYTTIRAPTTGRIGRSLVDPGNLVGAGEKTLLTTLVRYDPIYVYFTISERDLLRLADARFADDEADQIRLADGVTVEVGRATDEGFPLSGALDFADQVLDEETGTFLMRAVLDNPEPLTLIPGLFVRARLPLRELEGQLLVSERALGADQSGRYVLVVDEEDVAQYRPVRIGRLVDGMRVIRDGITAEDRVITNGVLFARPGARVKPELAAPDDASAEVADATRAEAD